jgi:tetratricopeptide (TPR) repeat protein
VNEHPSDTQLDALLADRLAPVEEARVRAHLDTCDGCADKVAARLPPAQVSRLHSLLREKTPGPAAAAARAGPPPVPGCGNLEEVGRGGFSTVYKAWQERLGRAVAVKVLNSAEPRRDELARFRREVAILARLAHPNVVQVFDGGEADGRPYMVLEYLPGGTLHRRWAGQPQPPREVAALVAALARAAHALHSAAGDPIVHRDLKPSNVLLAADGTPKLADFGFALLLPAAGAADPTPLTQTHAVLGTPGYMAPEQAAGKKHGQVGPAADVYALGAILYEGLTGRPPFKGDSALDTALQVLYQDPIPPRRRRPEVPAGLETICLKCLRKEPARRYASALALADDLENFLAGRPIAARRESVWGRTWSLARRYPLSAALAAALLLALIGGTAGSVGFAVRALREADGARASARRADDRLLLAVRAAADTAQLLAGSRRLQQADPALRQELLESSVSHLDTIVAQEGATPAAEAERGKALALRGLLRRQLSQMDQARQDYEAARDVFAALAAAHPAEPEYPRQQANALNGLGVIATQSHRRDEGLSHFQAAIDLRARLAHDFPGEPDYRFELAVSRMNLGNWHLTASDFAEAAAAYEGSDAVFQGLVEALPEKADYRFQLAHSLDNHGLALGSLGRAAEAAGLHRRALAERRRLVAGDAPADPEYRAYLASTLYLLGNAVRDGGRPAGAEPLYREAIGLLEKLTEEDKEAKTHPQELACNLLDLADCYLPGGPDRAEPLIRRAVGLQERLYRAEPDELDYAAHRGWGLVRLGDLARSRSKLDEAADWYGQALVPLRAAVKQDPDEPTAQRFWAEAQAGRALCLARAHRPDAAAAAETAARAAQAKAAGGAALVTAARALALVAGGPGEEQGRRRAAAVALLERAWLKHYFSVPARAKEVLEDVELADLRDREDFVRLRQALEGGR